MALRSSLTSNAGSFDPLCLIGGASRPQTTIDLGLLDPGPQSLGMDTQVIGDPADRTLGPCRVGQRLQRPSSWPARAAHRDTSSVP